MQVGIHHMTLDCSYCGTPSNADHIKGDLYLVQCANEACGQSSIAAPDADNFNVFDGEN